MKFKNHQFEYLVIFFLIIISIVSYYRFVIKQDYTVWYERSCDPSIESCFVGCEDEECTEEYYYSEMHKYAPDLYKQCGKDITDCEEASICLVSDKDCSIIYCDPEMDDNTCKIFLPEEVENIETEQASSTEDSILSENLINE